MVLARWGNLTPDGSFQYIPDGVTLREERTFGGYTIPTQVACGWWYGAEQYMEVAGITVASARLV
jgi:hypothetical protein